MKGYFKVVEEYGELLTVLGKLGPFPSGNHPDGKDNLYSRIADEIADCQAALEYLIYNNREMSTRLPYIKGRSREKLLKFIEWGLTDQEPPS